MKKKHTLFLPAGVFVAAAVLFLGFGGAFSASAAVANVSVVNNAFVPATTNISVNDTVIWTWGSGTFNHNVTSTSTPQAWPWPFPNENGPFTFTNKFTSANTYPYECTVHAGLGMKGSIIVAAAALPPGVTITNPANNALFAAPASVTIQAAVTAGSGTVTNVQFRVGPSVLANVTGAPFAATANNLTAGSYTFTAIASDSAGLSATNSIAVSVVTPVTISLTNAVAFSGTNFQFSYLVNTGLTYVVQFSPVLAAPNWISLATNVAASNPVVFVDTHATNQAGFYRVWRLPNP